MKEAIFPAKNILHYNVYEEYNAWTTMLLSLGMCSCTILVVCMYMKLDLK